MQGFRKLEFVRIRIVEMPETRRNFIQYLFCPELCPSRNTHTHICLENRLRKLIPSKTENISHDSFAIFSFLNLGACTWNINTPFGNQFSPRDNIAQFSARDRSKRPRDALFVPKGNGAQYDLHANSFADFTHSRKNFEH